jgi:hypothetical protein
VGEGLIYPAGNAVAGFKGLLIITDHRLMIISYKFKGILKTEIRGYNKIEYNIKLENIDEYLLSKKLIVGKSIDIVINPRLFPGAEKDLEIKLEKNNINVFYNSLSSALNSLKEKKNTINRVKNDDEKVVKERIIIRESVKLRCRYCGNLYDQGMNRCPHCGAAA